MRRGFKAKMRMRCDEWKEKESKKTRFHYNKINMKKMSDELCGAPQDYQDADGNLRDIRRDTRPQIWKFDGFHHHHPHDF